MSRENMCEGTSLYEIIQTHDIYHSHEVLGKRFYFPFLQVYSAQVTSSDIKLYLYQPSFKLIDDKANPLVKHSRRVKWKFLLKITHTKSQTPKSRYLTSNQQLELHSTLTNAQLLLQSRINESNRKLRVAASRTKRAN